jgi:hypothetical protein
MTMPREGILPSTIQYVRSRPIGSPQASAEAPNVRRCISSGHMRQLRYSPAHASAVGLDHLPQLPLEVGNLIAQPGGKLELQIGRGGVHLGGQLLHQVRKIAGR